MAHSKEEMQEKLRILEAYVQNKIAATSPEDHLRGGKKERIRMDLDRLFSDLTEHLDESGRTLFEEFRKSYEELLATEKSDSFVEGRVVGALILELRQDIKKRPRT